MTDAATAMHALKSGSVDMVGHERFWPTPLVNKLKAGKEEDPPLRRLRLLRRSGHQRVDAFASTMSRRRGGEGKPPPTAGPIKKGGDGGGPASEAARISAGRGHRVVLFEAARALGGQLLAAKATWKRDMAGITAWLLTDGAAHVDVRFNAYAEAADITRNALLVATGRAGMSVDSKASNSPLPPGTSWPATQVWTTSC